MEQRKLRIGLFVDVFYPMIDGVAVVVDNYAKRLSLIADVTVFAPSPRDPSYVDQFPYKVVRSRKLMVPDTDYDISFPHFDGKFMRELRKAKLDIVHIHSPFTIGIIGAQYAKTHLIPCVSTIHSQYQRDFLARTKSKSLTKFGIMGIVGIFNLMNECWAVNQTIADLFREFGVKRPIVVFHNATDLTPLPNDHDPELRTLHSIEDPVPVFLFVGRIDPLKNVFFIIDALTLLKERGQSFKMLFVGSGPATDELQKYIDDRLLSDQVTLVGRVAERQLISRYFRLADLFLFPSLYDASSLVQIEAASQRTPAVFLRGAATADAIIDNVNGYLSDNSPEAFAERILTILADPESLEQVRSQAQIDLYHSWDETVLSAYQRYRQLIEIKRQKTAAFFPKRSKKAD